MAKRKVAITASQAKGLDLKAQKDFGVPTLLLMENAGRAVSEEALKSIKDKKISVSIICGRGNNGGDGFCAARHLLVAGVKPHVFLAGKIADVKNEARVNLDILIRLKQKIFEVNERNLRLIKRKVLKRGLIIDALLGVGLRGEVSGVYRDLIALINSSSAQIISVDIPSGLDATSGKVLGCCVKAHKTITFVAKKKGMLKAGGPKHCGKVKVVDIGLPL